MLELMSSYQCIPLPPPPFSLLPSSQECICGLAGIVKFLESLEKHGSGPHLLVLSS